MTIDNFEILSSLLPETFDGDTFWYTELLDRSKRSGNNSGRRIRTFYHRNRQELFDQADQIRTACERESARAYFRPTARSFKQVGSAFTRHIIEQALTENWDGMRHGYGHACGVTPLKSRMIWLWDVDYPQRTLHTDKLQALPELVAVVPSRKGRHLLTRPFNRASYDLDTIVLHKDNPTNLYIPESAA